MATLRSQTRIVVDEGDGTRIQSRSISNLYLAAVQVHIATPLATLLLLSVASYVE